MVVRRSQETTKRTPKLKDAATTASYLHVGTALQYYPWIMQHLSIDLYYTM